jgi:ribonuclease R
MKSFAQALRRKRLAAGAIDLDLPEVRLKLDQDGRMVGWEKEEHDWSHQLIEDFMLAANRAVAEYLVAHEVLGLFRVHEEPDTGDLKQFAEFLSGFGLVLRPPYDRHKLKLVLDRVRGKDYQHAVHLALLTSLKQAHYSAECRPHYALNFTRYLHFTSPIRRYPDLIVHRALDECFQPEQKALPARGKKRRGAMGEEAYYRRLASLRQLAVHCSERERGADDAEEEYAKVLQIQYLRQHRRESHAGVIVRVTEKGLIVEMQDCYVEGFLAVEDLGDDRFEYVSQRHLLQGRRTRRSFRLGDKLSVRVSFIDVGARKVGLGLVET